MRSSFAQSSSRRAAVHLPLSGQPAVASPPPSPLPGGRGRGASTNPSGRFEALASTAFDDGWSTEERPAPLRTTVTPEHARRIITRNESPDIGFDRSINPYRGCEHGCIYCYARPSHAYMGLSPGLDFESRLFAKPDAAELLRRELARPGYTPAPIAMGTNTDPYQPTERRLKITRSILEVLDACSHPVTIVTKSVLVLRDADLLASMAARGLAKVAISITTLDRRLARTLEPRAPTPPRRMDAIAGLAAAGVPVSVMFAPVIPALNDAEMEAVLDGAKRAGATGAAWIPLRLPREVRELFEEWLHEHVPDRAEHVLSLVRSMRGGRLNDPRFGARFSGSGPYAWALARRFEIACRRLGLNRGGKQGRRHLDTSLFIPPTAQLRLL